MIFIARSIWKFIVRYGFKHITTPQVLIICDEGKTGRVLKRLLPSVYEGMFNICAIITNKEDRTYNDWYPYDFGLSNVKKYLGNKKIESAYVDLDNSSEEADVINELLSSEIIVHKSLGDGDFHYASQHIGNLGYKTVVSIEGINASLVSKTDKMIFNFMFGKKKNTEDE